jgi:hypothetical protein
MNQKKNKFIEIKEINGIKFKVTNEPFKYDKEFAKYANKAMLEEDRFEPLRQEIRRLAKK